MTKTEMNKECMKHDTCEECPHGKFTTYYGKFTAYKDWVCSIKNEDLEG